MNASSSLTSTSGPLAFPLMKGTGERRSSPGSLASPGLGRYTRNTVLGGITVSPVPTLDYLAPTRSGVGTLIGAEGTGLRSVRPERGDPTLQLAESSEMDVELREPVRWETKASHASTSTLSREFYECLMRFTAWAPNWDEMGADHITLSTASHAIQLAQEALAVAGGAVRGACSGWLSDAPVAIPERRRSGILRGTGRNGRHCRRRRERADP